MSDEVKELLISMISSPNTKDRKRKIVFWYDPKEEYLEYVNDLVFDDNTELIIFKDNSFKIRYHIEVEEPNKDIVLYLPIDRKKGLDNELLDLETANSDCIFNPDKTTMLLKEFNLSDNEHNIIKKYEKYFKDKQRKLRFAMFDEVDKNNDNIDLIITACLLNIKTINLDEILKAIVIGYYEDEKKIEDLFKLGDSAFIIDLINKYFGSTIKDETELELLFKSLVFSYFASDLDNLNEINRYSKYLLRKKTNVHIFVDMLMRDETTKKYFEKISSLVEKEFGIVELVNTLDIEHYKYNDAFICIDKAITNYICDSLNSDVGEYDRYREVIKIREGKYFYSKLSNEYNALKVACDFLENIDSIKNQIRVSDIDTFSKLYIDTLYEVDTLYRKFYYYFDKVDINEEFKQLKEKIENKYVNDFISELSIKWSETIEDLPKYDSNRMMLQNTFFKNYIKPFEDKKGRAIVIISDAFRYELAKELNYKLLELGAKSEVNYMLGLVPSYTKLGMASLLPNNKLSLIEGSDDILVDDMKSSSVNDRDSILKKECEESMAIKYDDLIAMTKPEWKKLFSGKKIVYIYHDTVDNAGEHNENKLFDACEQAINEIYELVKSLHTTFSGVDLYITADHGFFYKRSKLESSDKTKKDENATKQKTRFSYSDKKSTEEGIISINLDYLFGDNSGYVNIPKGNMIFGRQGSGFNYIHGGILPQEILVPVIDFKSNRNIEEAQKVEITYSGLSSKITNAITYLDFVQNNKVDENNKECRYLLHFEDENGERISNECVIIANYENTDVKDRFFREKFVFKNISYDKEKNYYLVITDEETGIESSRVRFTIDIAITNNFEF